jgi:hypothetical protein
MKCCYKNCDNKIAEGKRKDAKFCCTNCKKMEQTYRRRKKIMIEKYSKKEIELVNNFKKLVETIKRDIQK